jgi:DNA-binding transcriptional ArsR family regulator
VEDAEKGMWYFKNLRRKGEWSTVLLVNYRMKSKFCFIFFTILLFSHITIAAKIKPANVSSEKVKNEKLTTRELAELLALNYKTVLYHLRILREAGLVDVDKNGVLHVNSKPLNTDD